MFNAALLKDLVSQGGVAFRQTAVSWIFDCPRCQKHNKLYVRKKDGRFVCWYCSTTDNFQGACEYVLVALYGGAFAEYRRQLRGDEAPQMGLIHLEFDDPWGDDETFVDDRDPVFFGTDYPPTVVDREDHRFAIGRAYLASRGLDEAIIRKYDIRYSPADNRVLFPYVLGGEVVGWQGRLCGPNVIYDTLTGRKRELPKALTTIQEGIQNNYVMFAQNLVRSPHAILTEGPVSALKAELCGGNVCTLGKGVSESQLRFVAERVKRVYMALDADAGTDITRATNFLIGLGIEVYLMRVPPAVTARLKTQGKKADLGDCTFEEAKQAFDAAKEWVPGQMAISLGGELLF